MPNSIFLSLPTHLEAPRAEPKGGVQVATSEYIEVLKSAGLTPDIVAIDIDRSLGAKFRRRIGRSPYQNVFDDAAMLRAVADAGTSLQYVFLNTESLAQLGQRIRQVADRNTKIVLLSIGPFLGDLPLEYRLRKFLADWGIATPVRSATAVGRIFCDEVAIRQSLDAVVSLSEEDAALETWLGVPSVIWLPRTVTARPIAWDGPSRVLGFVGTLEHTPNLDGLISSLVALEEERAAEMGWMVEIVGGPERIGCRIAKRFPFVRYLGRLDDVALERAAAKWAAFLHPIFVSCRGASTKLALGLAWEIPVVVSRFGARGYRGLGAHLAFHDSPRSFALECLRMHDERHSHEVRTQVRHASASSPGLRDTGRELRMALETLLTPACSADQG